MIDVFISERLDKDDIYDIYKDDNIYSWILIQILKNVTFPIAVKWKEPRFI